MTRRETFRAIMGTAGVISGVAVKRGATWHRIGVEPIKVRRGDRVTVLVRDNMWRVIEVQHGG